MDVGGDVGMLGIDSFIGVMFQGLFIIISGKFERMPAHLRMVLMCALLVAELVVTGLAKSPFLIIMGMVFANVSYGIMMPTMRELVRTGYKVCAGASAQHGAQPFRSDLRKPFGDHFTDLFQRVDSQSGDKIRCCNRALHHRSANDSDAAKKELPVSTAFRSCTSAPHLI